MNSCSFGEELEKNKDSEEKFVSDLMAVKQWLNKMTYLPSLGYSDLALFWHRSNNNLTLTKVNIENYFWMRTILPEFFANRDPHSKDLVDTLASVCIIVLPDPTPEGYYVVLLRLLNCNPLRHNFNQSVKYLHMVIDIHIYREGTSNGYVLVCDLKGVSSKHLENLPDRSFRKFFLYLKKGVHFRWKGLHYVNSSSKSDDINDYIKRNVINLQKNRNIILHKDMASLSKIVPLELLPEEMGGLAGNIKEIHQVQVNQLKDYSGWFKVEERYRVDQLEHVKFENMNRRA